MSKRSYIVFGLAVTLALVPGTAFATTGALQAATLPSEAVAVSEEVPAPDALSVADLSAEISRAQSQALDADDANGASETDVAEDTLLAASAGKLATAVEARHAHAAAKVDKVLAYDPADIAAIGTQQSTGHWVCCPSFSCAYADAVLDGTVHSHDYYTCSWCTWTDWGGGNSAYRSLGTDEQLLREAYDQIASGRPTVVHVSGGYNEHWIALIGYQDAVDPDHLTLANFIALDPVDGAQIVASDRYVLYGDACEHISTR